MTPSVHLPLPGFEVDSDDAVRGGTQRPERSIKSSPGGGVRPLQEVRSMRLLPLDTPQLIELAAGWLAQKENYQWLDFGNGRQLVTPTILKIMVQRDTNFMRVYTSDTDDVPVGIVGLHNVDHVFKTATFWGLSGDKSFRNRGLSTLASSKLMTIAFRDLGLRAVNTWAADGNPSIRTIERLAFRYIGRLRQSHYIDGRPCDRLLFDLLASEHRVMDENRWRRMEKAHRQPACGARQTRVG
jgi:RimJ/RimL family protein N-acetyltransferase